MVPLAFHCKYDKLVVYAISLFVMIVNHRFVYNIGIRPCRKALVLAWSYQHSLGAYRYRSESRLASDNSFHLSQMPNTEDVFNDPPVKTLLVHWRGEDVEGYTLQFRNIEFHSALAAVLDRDGNNELSIHFENALNYTGTQLTSPLKINAYNQAMQYLFLPDTISLSSCIEAAKRCSLIHSLYLSVAETDSRYNIDNNNTSNDSYDQLAHIAVRNNAFADMRVGGINAHQSWCVRVRHYGSDNNANGDDQEATSSRNDRRYGERTRSITLERRALTALTPLLRDLGGKVNLHQPDCKIYVFDGLLPRSMGHVPTDGDQQKVPTKLVLARHISSGARREVTAIHPTTRICVTNTPLCPLASFIMTNIARVRTTGDGFAVLDPYCGSGGTLLAAAMVLQMSSADKLQGKTAPQMLVGIEISHDGLVNRDDIRRDFTTRSWTDPITLLKGDSTQPNVRRMARDAIGDRPFDAIITDPPYGIRESNQGGNAPIHDLLQMIGEDRDAGIPLLRIGGRLVVFIPHRVNENSTSDIFPTRDQLRTAGLVMEYCQEQPLNDALSRWLISYVCVR